MKSEEELSNVIAVFENLGSSPEQAETMAKQVIKRVDQWVEERGMDRIEAMKRMLELVVAGRQGKSPPGFEPEKETRQFPADEK